MGATKRAVKRAIKRAFVLAASVSGFAMGIAPATHASSEVLSGTYDVVGPNSTMDTWVITPDCSEPVAGCQADIHSSWVGGQAKYVGANTWTMTLMGLVPVCSDRSMTKGAMVFQWNARTLEGQLTSVQRGPCQMTRPGTNQTSFRLVKVTG